MVVPRNYREGQMSATHGFSEPLLRAIVESLEDIIFHIDPAGLIRSWHAPSPTDLYTNPAEPKTNISRMSCRLNFADRFATAFERAKTRM